MAVLRVVKGLTPGQLFPLEKETSILGRHPECDIVLDVGAVSRQHAQIIKTGECFFVEDLGSRNGTYVDDQRVEGRRKLAEGEQLRICDLVFVFHKGPPGATVDRREEATEAAILVDDERPAGSSTVMSRLDISSGSSGLRLTVNPEVKLKAILEIGRNLGRALSLDEVLGKLLDNLFSVFLQADRGFVVLRDAGNKLVPKAVKHRRGDAGEPIRISRTIVNGVIATKEAILSADAATDSRFDMAQSIVDFQIHSMMCVPLVASEGQVLGVLQIDTVDPRHRFNRDDLEVLASVACQAAVAVENAQLHEIALRDQLLRTELAQGRRVQKAFLPSSSPELAGYDFFAFYEPANHLGGDYYDYIPLSGGRLAVMLGDVSGKGTPAALLMAKLSAEARYCLAIEPSLNTAISRLNNVFSDDSWEGRFVTLIAAIVDPLTHDVLIANAGHMAPLLRRPNGQVEEVGKGKASLPLGVVNDVEYAPFSVRLGPGESIALYTDGITEAMNATNDLFGAPRLHSTLAKATGGVPVLGEMIVGDVRRFVGTRSQSDDMCVVCFGRRS